MDRSRLLNWLLLLGILAAFSQAINCDFVNYDDDKYVVLNEHVRHGVTLKGILWAFSEGYAYNWHPLTWISHMLDCQVYGLKPGGHHLTSLLLHMVNAGLLFHLLWRATGYMWRSAVVAALFAVHPLHVQSVVWVSERKDVLSATFWFLTMWAYLRYVERPRLRSQVLVVVSYALGLMAKPMLVTLPFVLLLMDCWPLRRMGIGCAGAPDKPCTWSRLVWEKVPLFLLAVASSVVTFLVQQSGGAVRSFEQYSLPVRFANSLVAYVGYLAKTVWPSGLAVFYPHPGDSLSAWQVIGAGLLLACITVLAIRLRKDRPYLTVGWLWYIGTLLPVIGLVQVGDQAMADRYTYIPLVGIFLIAAWGIPDLLGRSPALSRALPTVSCLVIVACAASTWVHTGYWRSSITLFQRALRVTSDNAVAHNNLGVALEEHGEARQAMWHYRRSLQIYPDRPEAHYNLGRALLESRGDIAGAARELREAIRIKPDYANAHGYLAEVLYRQGDYAGAWTEVRLCRKYGGHPAQELVRKLSRKPHPIPSARQR